MRTVIVLLLALSAGAYAAEGKPLAPSTQVERLAAFNITDYISKSEPSLVACVNKIVSRLTRSASPFPMLGR